MLLKIQKTLSLKMKMKERKSSNVKLVQKGFQLPIILKVTTELFMIRSKMSNVTSVTQLSETRTILENTKRVCMENIHVTFVMKFCHLCHLGSITICVFTKLARILSNVNLANMPQLTSRVLEFT